MGWVVAAIIVGVAWYFRHQLVRKLNLTRAELNEKVAEEERNSTVALQQQRIDNAKGDLVTWRKKFLDARGKIEPQIVKVDKLTNKVATLAGVVQRRRESVLQLEKPQEGESDADRQAREKRLADTRAVLLLDLKEYKGKQRELEEAKALLDTLQAQLQEASDKIKGVDEQVKDAEEKLGTDRSRLNMASVGAEIAETASVICGGATNIEGLKAGADAVETEIAEKIGRAKGVQILEYDEEAELRRRVEAIEGKTEADTDLAEFMASGTLPK